MRAAGFMSATMLMLCSSAAIGQIDYRTVTPGGGATSKGADGTTQVSATALGMAVGEQSGGGVTARHGFLASATRIRDEEPPVFDPEPVDRVVSAGANCIATFDLTAITVTDNRDRNPTVTVSLRTRPPQDIDPAGEQVSLPLGSYDVIATATDRYGNSAQIAYRIDVIDDTAPQMVPVPDPTPVGQEVQASSPVGTGVPFAFNCADNCDPDPVGAITPVRPRYSVGDTALVASCEDATGNRLEEDVVIRVRDTQAPRLAGAAPGDLNLACDTPAGANFAVPGLVWIDNGTPSDDLVQRLIIDPAGENRAVQPIPARLTLARGIHILRYVAADAAGNEQVVDLRVSVIDQGVPTIDVVSSPPGGWFSGDGPLTIELDIADGCSGGAGALNIGIQPPPDAMQIDGDRVSLTYSREGIYSLQVVATDADDNTTRDNSIGFGIDRNPPAPVIRTPLQLGVIADDESTMPLFALAERMALDAGGEEEADGIASGIANVTVVLDPDGAGRVISDHDFPGAGNPPRGQRLIGGVKCEKRSVGVGGDDRFCNAQDEFDLRYVGKGVQELEVTVTDFAGNSSSTRAYFKIINLFDATAIVVDGLAGVVANNPAPVVRGQTLLAVRSLRRAEALAELEVANSRYHLPVFLGAALRGAQDATVSLVAAIGAAGGANRDTLVDMTHLLHRAARSDVELTAFHANTVQRNLPRFLDDALTTDVDFTEQFLALVDRQIAAADWNQSMSNITLGAFHAKSALKLWIMDYYYEPNAGNNPAVMDEYARGRDLVAEILAEINLYLTLDTKPAANTMRQIRNRLASVLDRLNLLVDEGFDDIGLSDEAYVNALIDLRDVANFSQLAGNQLAYVRNYQWSMMQVVRYMTQASMRDAIFWRGAGRRAWPIYTQGLALVDDGVELLDARRAQSTIDLYGTDEDAICLVVAVYHCDFLNDDVNDPDQALDVAAVPDYCWDRMYRPGEWGDMSSVNRVPPRCQYGAGLRD